MVQLCEELGNFNTR